MPLSVLIVDDEDLARDGCRMVLAKDPEIFAVTRAVRDSPHALVTRLVNGQITYVHRRLWPALARVAPRLPRAATARLREVHTRTGAHRVDWVPANRIKNPRGIELRRQSAG